MRPILTHYLYPLSQSIPFLPSYGVSFDNPRTPDEIAEVESLLRIAVPDGNSLWSTLKASDPDFTPCDFSLKSVLLSILERFPPDDEHVRQAILESLDAEPFTALAKMWVWIRIDEGKGKHSQVITGRSYDENDIYCPKDNPEHIVENIIRQLVYFASLLACEDNYWDYRSFLRGRSTREDNFDLGSILFGYRLSCISEISGSKPMSWFHKELNGLLEAFNNLDNSLNSPDQELILYLANLIEASVNHTLTEKARLLLLVSIVELMLTHNPDFNRFNVEDSIGKQFLLKLSVILYRENESLKIPELRENLRHIYNLRSKIAHGDYTGLKKAICKKLSRNDYNSHMEEYHLGELNSMLYCYIRTLMKEYFRCPDFIKFLKES